MQKLVTRLQHIHWTIFAVTLGFASVVEWAHCRRFMAKRDPRMITTAIAAISAGYMASEALEGSWPSWKGNGYDE
jgi:hypothetical protein